MGWEVTPSEGVEITSRESKNTDITFPKNETTSDITYVVRYVDSLGDCGSKEITVKACGNMPCQLEQVPYSESSIIPPTPGDNYFYLFTYTLNERDCQFNVEELSPGSAIREIKVVTSSDNQYKIIEARFNDNPGYNRTVKVKVTLVNDCRAGDTCEGVFEFEQKGSLGPEPGPTPPVGNKIRLYFKNNSSGEHRGDAYLSGYLNIEFSQNSSAVAGADGNKTVLVTLCDHDCITTDGYNTKHWMYNHFRISVGETKLTQYNSQGQSTGTLDYVDADISSLGSGTWYFVGYDSSGGQSATWPNVQRLAFGLMHAAKGPTKLVEDNGEYRAAGRCPRCVDRNAFLVHVKPLRGVQVTAGSSYTLEIDGVRHKDGNYHPDYNPSNKLPVITNPGASAPNCTCTYGDGTCLKSNEQPC